MKKYLLVASDHAGVKLKEELKQSYPEYNWQDLGPFSEESVDYPDFADKFAQEAKGLNFPSGDEIVGVLICGSGIGMCIRANRYPELRAVLCWNEESASLARSHNKANVLCLGERLTSADLAKKIFRTFMATAFAGGRHQQRIDKLSSPIGE